MPRVMVLYLLSSTSDLAKIIMGIALLLFGALLEPITHVTTVSIIDNIRPFTDSALLHASINHLFPSIPIYVLDEIMSLTLHATKTKRKRI